MNKDIISGNTTNRWERIPYDIVISANDNLVDFGRQTVSVTPDSLFTGGKTLAGPANYGQSMVEVVQRAITEGRIDVGAITGVSDGVTTGGTYNTGTGAINFNVSSPGTPFSVTLPNIPTDLSNLTDTTDLLKSYTLQLDGTTGFKLVDENGTDVSIIPFPSGLTDTFTTFVEGTDSTVFTSADGLTMVTIPTTATGLPLADLGGNTTATNVEDAIAELYAQAQTYTLTAPSNSLVSLTDKTGTAVSTFRRDLFAVNGTPDNIVTTFTPTAQSDPLLGNTWTVDSYIFGSDTATINQVATSDGAGGITWTTPAAGSAIDSVITDGSTNAVENNAIFDALALKLDITDLKTYSFAHPNNNTIELRDEDNTLVSTFNRDSFSKADTDSIITTVAATNQVPNANGRDINYSSVLNVAPTQGGIPNALSIIAGQGVYVPQSAATDLWYEGGDFMRVYATYDAFVTGYTKTATGAYSFVVPAGEQLHRIEYIPLTGSANQNIDNSNQTIFTITTPNGNTSLLDTSTPTVMYKSTSTGQNLTSTSGTSSTWTTSATGGVLTLTGSNLNSHNAGKISITNLTQNA